MMDGYSKENVSRDRAMEQRKDEVWTLELGELRYCCVSIIIFFRDWIGSRDTPYLAIFEDLSFVQPLPN